MTQATDSTATATLSGRELALKRRQAMALHGKTGTAKAKAASMNKPAAQRVNPAPAATNDAALLAQAQTALASSGRSASRARREALSAAGKAALQPTAARPSGRVRPQSATVPAMAAAAEAPKSCGCGCNGTKASCDTTVENNVRPAAAVTPVEILAAKQSSAPTGRALARARRAALAQDGKAGLKRVAQATKIAAALPNQDWEAAIAKGATGRQVAMQRRLVQSLTGRSAAKNDDARPTGRVRARVETPAPAKVEVGHTLSGRGVTGTMVERSKKVTGNEPGSCRAVTGTEYIGAEQFDTVCTTTRPLPTPSKIAVSQTSREHAVTGTSVSRSEKVTGNEPGSTRAITGTDYVSPSNGVTAPEKVNVSHTSHGKTVTGTAVGHATKVTGDENGACRGITGTEYLATEQFASLCGTSAPETPRKVSVMSSRGNLPVSGTEVGRSAKVTGDEPGSCRSITGSQYYTSESFGALCDSASPKKVALMHTLAGRTLTGTEVGRSPKVTGDEMGGCKSVTGTEYIGADQQQAVCAASSPVAPIAKVAIDQTWRGQPVTGSYVGRSASVTGDEPGGCSPISGTPYIGRGQYNNFCESPATQAQEARIRSSASIPAIAVTGDRPGAGGSVMTGDERGACGPVSGTPYVGVDNTATQCATSGRFVPRPAWEEPARAPAPVDFSISTPARAAQQKQSGDVTGTAYNSERITGPVNKATGLITGTPEFRHRDVAPAQAQAGQVEGALRLTGEGSQAGRPVTGDAWSAMSKVTGTEGASSLARNPSSRGNPRGMGVNAAHFREVIEHPVVPESRITGSSGNTGRGALVTLSGGARG